MNRDRDMHDRADGTTERTWRWRQDAPAERTILVGIDLPERFDGGLGGEADLDELGRLVDTAGGEVVGRVQQARPRPDARTFIGRGKLEELGDLVRDTEATLVVLDNDLAPAQGRNLEKALEVNVLDRTELILDIFANHARTQQARLQVELAQLQYLLPRLRRLWSHLERQAGGIGTRGPGETQLETDRRLVGRRIAHLKRSLREIETRRGVQRKGRSDLFNAVLVGYTNAGKSTLMNAMTGADVLVRDRLFATLDATTRHVDLDERRRFLLTDTVGFIRRLPHHLVESFKATLQEVVEADLLLHVVDAAGRDPRRQIDAVDRVLAELVPEPRPTLLVFNQMDRVEDPYFRNEYERHFPDSLFVSALEPAGGEAVRDAVAARLTAAERVYVLRVPVGRLGALGAFHRSGSVIDQTFVDGACLATVRMREGELELLLAREPKLTVLEGRT